MPGVHTYIISTVGTSLLTNRADDDTLKLLRRTANYSQQRFPQDEFDRVVHRADDTARNLMEATDDQVRAMSAELNGILKMDAVGSDCSHYLLHTDTYQGERAASAAAQYLRSRDCRLVVTCRMDSLTTDSQEAFTKGIDNLLRWCDQTLPALRQQSAQVVFNLSGSFKSLQAYAQTIGMIYADELWYVFENRDSPVIRIPRLPLKMDDAPLRENAATFARLAEGQIIEAGNLPSVPEAYVERDGDHVTLSPWGLLTWNSCKRSILAARLADQPGLRFNSSFEADWNKCRDDGMRVDLQETLARVAMLWQSHGLQGLRADGGLQYSNMVGHSGVGHFRLTQGWRVSCSPEGNDLLLRHFGLHDYVNDNP